MFRLDLVILRPILTFVLPDNMHTLGSHRVYSWLKYMLAQHLWTRWDPKVCTLSGNTNVNIGLRITKSSRNT